MGNVSAGSGSPTVIISFRVSVMVSSVAASFDNDSNRPRLNPATARLMVKEGADNLQPRPLVGATPSYRVCRHVRPLRRVRVSPTPRTVAPEVEPAPLSGQDSP